MNYKSFDFSGVAVKNGNFLGFPYTTSQAQIIFLPVPWDMTTSYSAGTADGPKAIIEASTQLDVVDLDVPKAHTFGYAVAAFPEHIYASNQEHRPLAKAIIDALERGATPSKSDLAQANKASEELNEHVYQQSKQWLAQEKLVLLIGGDHSTPYGALRAVGEKHGDFGILQIDAHADLRIAYEGFTHSHASIMHNALKLPNVKELVQVGIRDLSDKELQTIGTDSRIHCFFDQHLQEKALNGKSWKKICKKIVDQLPKNVYVSIDIDGLQPFLCPNTGTPVMGGLSFYQVLMILKEVVLSGRTIVGADVVEVNPEKEGEWNANVGARMVYKLANLMAASNKLKPLF